MTRFLQLCALLAAVLSPGAAAADMGQVHASAVEVSESSQKAIILHNGSEEILILGTDLHSSETLGVIRFIPFPSEPIVALAPAGAFDRLAGLVRERGLAYLEASKGGPPQAAAVELRLHKRLGAHDMTVIKVTDPIRFRDWVNAYFAAKGLPVQADYATAEAVVADYVRRGIVYFVLDFVEVTPETRFVEPVVYRFASRELYYPLKTTNTFGGRGEIDLALLLPGSLCEPSLGAYDTCLGFTHYIDHWQASTSAAVSPEELQSLFPEAVAFFDGRQAFLQMIAYRGDYAFDRDIVTDIGSARPLAYGFAQEQTGTPWIIPIQEILKDAAAEGRDPRCSQQPDPGPCKGLFQKYYFDQTAGECRNFFYGGCQGSAPFDSQEECAARCR